MTIYTLYIKTHKKTGLKYLGQTVKNPFIYKGSGVDWGNHLKQYGYDVHTDIVLQTTDWNELKNKGRYYSEYYHVLTAVDDFGNKIWANRIPETGGGDGSHSLDTIWIHRGNDKKMVAHNIIDNYLTNGWTKGLPNSPTQGKIWIYNQVTNEYSLCNNSELDFKLSRGWIKKKWAPIPVGTKRITTTCCHCGKLSDQGNHNRWHGDNCKLSPLRS